VDLLKTL